jgi:puromycin-sensitive aminopeptidase
MSSEVRSQDTVFVIGGVAANPKGRELAWKFVQEKWDELFVRYDGGFLLSRLVQTTTGDFTTEEKAKEVEAFFAVHKAPAAERAVRQSVEKIHSNARWLATDREAMDKWFAEWYDSLTPSYTRSRAQTIRASASSSFNTQLTPRALRRLLLLHRAAGH